MSNAPAATRSRLCSATPKPWSFALDAQRCSANRLAAKPVSRKDALSVESSTKMASSLSWLEFVPSFPSSSRDGAAIRMSLFFPQMSSEEELRDVDTQKNIHRASIAFQLYADRLFLNGCSRCLIYVLELGNFYRITIKQQKNTSMTK